MMQRNEGVLAVQDPDPDIGGGGGIGGEAGLRTKKFFRPFGPQFGLEIREGPDPPGPSATVWYIPQLISGGDAHMQGFDYLHSQYPVC